MHVEQAGTLPSHYKDVSNDDQEHNGAGTNTLLLRFLQGMHADETARRLLVLGSLAASTPSGAPGSSLGRRGRGGITQERARFDDR